MFNCLNHDKLLKAIQNIVLVNIFRNADVDKKFGHTVENLVEELKKSKDPLITHKFCTIDSFTIQRIYSDINKIISQINEDMEPYRLKISENGTTCIHQITQTFVIRIMQEVRRISEWAPLITFEKEKSNQKEIFIANLTDNQEEMDKKLAERTSYDLAYAIVKNI